MEKQKEINESRKTIQKGYHMPVDCGWAWVILAGCAVVYFLFVGTLRSFGLFFVEYLEVFGASVSMTSLVSGVQTATYSLVSWPLLTVGLQFISVRQSAMIGAFLCSLSYGLNSLATSIEFLVVTQSIIFGAGTAFLYSPSLIIVGKYFDKRRGLANGITIAGSSLGGLVFPPLYSYILYNYGLNGAMIVTSGILLNLFVAAALLRPPSFYQKPQRKSDVTLNGISNDSSIKIFNDIDGKTTVSQPMLLTEISTDDRRTVSQPMLGTKSQTFVHAEIQSEKRFKTFSEITHLKFRNSTESILDKLSNSNLVRYLSRGEMTSQLFIDPEHSDMKSEKFTNDLKSNCFTKLKTIFFFDTSLITHFPYVLNLIGYSFGSVAGAIGFIYVPSFAVEKGVNVKKTALLLSVFGAADLIGRILSGYLADHKLIRKPYIVAISQAIVSLLMHLTRYCTDFGLFVMFSGIVGLFAGMIISLNPTIMMDITGIHKYANGIAINALVTGISLGSTAPFLGFLRDYTGTYYMTFHYIGITSSISMLVYIVMPFIVKSEVMKDISVEVDATC